MVSKPTPANNSSSDAMVGECPSSLPQHNSSLEILPGEKLSSDSSSSLSAAVLAAAAVLVLVAAAA